MDRIELVDVRFDLAHDVGAVLGSIETIRSPSARKTLLVKPWTAATRVESIDRFDEPNPRR